MTVQDLITKLSKPRQPARVLQFQGRWHVCACRKRVPRLRILRGRRIY